MKAKVYENNWSAKNIRSTKEKIEICLLEMDLDLIQKTTGIVHKIL